VLRYPVNVAIRGHGQLVQTIEDEVSGGLPVQIIEIVYQLQSIGPSIFPVDNQGLMI
jgi:hypothetical protein